MDVTSEKEEARLGTGARVECLELVGERLRYRLLSGTGPKTGWVSTKLTHKDLVVLVQTEVPSEAKEVASSEAVAAGSRGPVLKHFDLLKGPQGRDDLSFDDKLPSGLCEALKQFGIDDFKLDSVLRTELGRDKFFIRPTAAAPEVPKALFVGRVEGPEAAKVEAAMTAFSLIGEHCRPEFVSVTAFRRSSAGTFLQNRYLLSPSHGESNWKRGKEDRLMLARAIGELHRASSKAFQKGFPAQVEEGMEEKEMGLGVFDWGFTVDYEDSGLLGMEISRIHFILGSLRMQGRGERIEALNKYVVHGDLQFKNFCRSLEHGASAP
eukprot:CAMPEP_0180786344 /NCGR_PEP_ID=MMETSP1038_2-20121128/50744_1 /TAXON_ID=632150 /ORGANISM="Azadinium spinosum, Strain 3D9" /LENGTH=322 /DNA_ID=CAMNT_0022823447 /DNA_START=33 /DNA_END=997 /DNA_ORIENTATION=-